MPPVNAFTVLLVFFLIVAVVVAMIMPVCSAFQVFVQRAGLIRLRIFVGNVPILLCVPVALVLQELIAVVVGRLLQLADRLRR